MLVETLPEFLAAPETPHLMLYQGPYKPTYRIFNPPPKPDEVTPSVWFYEILPGHLGGNDFTSPPFASFVEARDTLIKEHIDACNPDPKP